MNSLDAKLAQLAADFAARAAGERAAVVAALAADDRSTLQDRAHKLAGIAPMMGFAAIGEAALALEATAENGADCAAPAQRLCALLANLA